ncbi:MAG: phospholipid scramblase-related protein [Ilumatobacteraceae bacterium]
MDIMTNTPANWYDDPTGRHQHRYWDGNAWTSHVSDDGIQGTDDITAASAAPTEQSAPSGLDRLDAGLTVGDEGSKVDEQLHGGGRRGVGIEGTVEGGGGGILTEPILVVNQKAKLIELSNQYTVFDQHGAAIAAVNQVGQSTARKVLRLVSSLDQFLKTRLDITDSDGRVILRLTRPGKIVKSTVIVSDGNDVELGRIVQQNAIGKINFALEAGGERLGSIKAENWRAWNFSITDAADREIARVTKTWEGLAKTMFTTADNYVLQISERASEPLNSLVVASALSIDTALKQDNRGLG